MKPHHRLYLSALLIDCALMAGGTAVPFVVFDRLGGGAGMSGVIAAIHSLSYALLSLFSARFITRTRSSISWAYIGTIQYGVLYSAAVLLSNPYLYALVSMLGFMGLALVWPAQWSWLGAEPDVAVRIRRISHYNVSWSAGLTIGPLLAGPLYALDFRLPFALVFGLSAVAVWLQYALPQEGDSTAPPKSAAGELPKQPVGEQFLYASWYANFLGWVLLAAGRSVYPKRVADLAAAGFLTGAGPLAFSWLSFTMNGARLLVFILMGLTRRWQDRMGILFFSQALGALACWILSWTTDFWTMLGSCDLIGVCGGVCFFYSAFYSLVDPDKKHQRTAINESMVGGGSFAGSMGFGLLASRYGVEMPFRWTPLLVSVGFGLQFALIWWGRRRRNAF